MAERQNPGINVTSNPGSYNDFLERTGMQPGPEAIDAMSEELKRFKEDLATARGFDNLEELHTAPLDLVRSDQAVSVGSIALAG